MLQLIGWLGCVYLAVKVLGLMANPAYRDANGGLKGEAMLAILVGWAGVAIFAFAFLLQGNSMRPGLDNSSIGGSSQAFDECLGDPNTTLAECNALK